MCLVYRAYQVPLSQLLPADIGAAAAYEAYRTWKHNSFLYEPLSADRERQREGLIGMAIAESEFFFVVCISLLGVLCGCSGCTRRALVLYSSSARSQGVSCRNRQRSERQYRSGLEPHEHIGIILLRYVTVIIDCKATGIHSMARSLGGVLGALRNNDPPEHESTCYTRSMCRPHTCTDITRC